MLQTKLVERSSLAEMFRELAKKLDEGSLNDLAVFRSTRDFLVLFVSKTNEISNPYSGTALSFL